MISSDGKGKLQITWGESFFSSSSCGCAMIDAANLGHSIFILDSKLLAPVVYYAESD